MSQEISLQDLIEKIKSDLFSPYESTSISKKKIYPLFLIEQVEIELKVDITYETGAGIKIAVPQLVEASLDGKGASNTGHTMKVVLKPILTPEQMRELVSKDAHMMEGITQASLAVMKKGVEMAGEEE